MIIYAINIHQGGGKVLLLSLLSKIQKPSLLFADSRLGWESKDNPQVVKVPIRPRILDRLLAEFKLRRAAREGTPVLCFGNLPPLLALRGPVSLYFQNTILFESNAHLPFSWKAKVKHAIERLWLRWGMGHVDTVYVQSAAVRSGFLHAFPGKKVVIAPFMEPVEKRPAKESKEFEFVFVASGDPHKNHGRLLQAWEILGEAGFFPPLALTLSDQDDRLLSRVAELNKKGLIIRNFPRLSHDQVLELYSRCHALIFPSLTESFGLPLLEAKAAGLPVVAAELDYVREVVSPVQSFDPLSEKSIARAVLRFLGKDPLEDLQPILTSEGFLEVLTAHHKN